MRSLTLLAALAALCTTGVVAQQRPSPAPAPQPAPTPQVTAPTDAAARPWMRERATARLAGRPYRGRTAFGRPGLWWRPVRPGMGPLDARPGRMLLMRSGMRMGPAAWLHPARPLGPAMRMGYRSGWRAGWRDGMRAERRSWRRFGPI